jgi:hypothetical protein
MVEIYSMPIVDIRRRISQYKAIPMVNKRDAEVFIVCLSCHFDVGLFHVIGQEVPRWRFSMIRVCLQWQELAWDLSRVAWGLGIHTSWDTEVFNLWFVKHMLHNCTRINFNHLRCLWWGQWELKASKYHNFWRFYKTCNPCFPLWRAFLLLLCWVSTFYLYAPSKRA